MGKMLWRTVALATILMMTSSGVALAIPSLGGPTGVVSTPSAIVAPMGGVQGALSYQSLEVGGDTTEDYSAWALQALAGVTDKAELWAAYGSVRDGEDTHIWAFGGKLQALAEPTGQTKFAVGGAYRSWADGADADVRNAYLVVTKDLTPLGGEGWEWRPTGGTTLVGSLGLMYLSLDPDLPGVDSEALTRPFVNLEFTGVGGTTLGLEYRWKDSDLDAQAVFSAVVRQALSGELTGELGTTNSNPLGFGLDDQDWFVRLAYSMPFGEPGW